MASGLELHHPKHRSSGERPTSIIPSPFYPVLTTLSFCLQQKKPKLAANPNSNDHHPRTRGTISFEATALYTSPRHDKRQLLGVQYPVQSPHLMLQHAAMYQAKLTSPQL